jgi:hypothetical protein
MFWFSGEEKRKEGKRNFMLQIFLVQNRGDK